MKSGTRSEELEGGASGEPGADASPDASASIDLDGDDAEADVLAKGTFVGRYLVLERLGAGAMGVVYAAYDPELDRKIALKLLSRQQGRGGDKARRQERLVREAKAIAKLSHPNVVGIFDVGVHEGQVFMAMEYLGGGTLRDWMTAKKRPWREIVKMFIEVGQGLAAAHAEGLIHRDFKPDNVLLDKAGKPKVADFGLVRLRSSGTDTAETPDTDESAVITEERPLAETALAPLTRTGAIAGTPAYMAPEQFLGKPIDARTDQFAFCVALYEALYGERPFAGETVLALGGQVTSGRVREAAKDAQVPRWLRQLVLRGLQGAPQSRFETMAELVSILGVDPMRVRRRWVATAAVVVAVLAAAATIRNSSMRHQQRIDSEIAAKVREAEAALAIAAEARPRFLSKSAAAFAAFAGMNRPIGERLWREALAAAAVMDGSYERTERAFEAALLIDHNRPTVRDRLCEVIYDRLVLAETLGQNASASVYAAKLGQIDRSGGFSARLAAPGTVAVNVVPADVELRLESYRTDSSGARTLRKEQDVTVESLRNLQLAPGSYRLTVRRLGAKTDVFFPFVLARSESLTANLRIPDDAQVPAGFVYVPSGRFLFGEADEPFRTAFLDTVPIGAASTGAFFVARHETTYADWIAYLESLPPRERAARLPHIASSVEGRYFGAVDLKEVSPNEWRLRLTPAGVEYTATAGNPLVYPGRTERRAQDWRKFPVSGVSARDAEAYARWLASTGRVPGARLCSEKEWERAARGADDRRFPHGDYLGDDEANFDETYGRRPDAFGPDEVGAHPQSVSAFGVQDLVGNVIEMTTSSLEPNGLVARGGGFYHDRRSAWASNRVPLERGTRSHTFGIRLCAEAPGDTADKRGSP